MSDYAEHLWCPDGHRIEATSEDVIATLEVRGWNREEDGEWLPAEHGLFSYGDGETRHDEQGRYLVVCSDGEIHPIDDCTHVPPEVGLAIDIRAALGEDANVDLDSLIQDLKSAEAAKLHTGGVPEQIEYLLGCGYSIETLRMELQLEDGEES